MVTVDHWQRVTITALVVAFTASVVATPSETAMARGFFVIAVVGGIVASAGLRGTRQQASVAVILSGLIVSQRLPWGHPVAEPPAPDWRVQLENVDDRASTVIVLAEPEWQAALARAHSVGVYICAEAIGQRDRALTLTLSGANGSMNFPIGTNQAFGARARPNQGGFYRANVPKAIISGIPEITLSVTRDDFDERPSVAPFICGAHILRSSRYASQSTLLRSGRLLTPGPKGLGRWVIELRAEDAKGHVILAWY